MPFIESKVSVKISEEQERELKERLGQAISLIPGKSESWLMLNFEDNCRMYFRGDNSSPIAFVDIRMFGNPNRAAFDKMTTEVTNIFGDVLGIPSDHMYIRYMATNEWGWSGSNF